MSNMTSVIIPARNEPYLKRTVEDVLAHAAGDIEVIVVLDGPHDDQRLPDDARLRVIHNREPQGTRRCINHAALAANGKYLFKLDAHCMVSEGFDAELTSSHNHDCVVTLPRYSLDPVKWGRTFGPVCYEYIGWPMDRLPHIGGLTPKKWHGPTGIGPNYGKKAFYWREKERADLTIDEIQACNAACWFVTKDKYLSLGGLDERLWSFHIDGVEIGFKAWLSGGALLINKRGWHAHWYKSEPKRTVPLNWSAMRNTQAYSTWYWTHDKWPLARRSFAWFVEHFWPIPGWPDDWKQQLASIPEVELEQASA
jgi:glycosyltransferase involved in cell wall biosynthesis